MEHSIAILSELIKTEVQQYKGLLLSEIQKQTELDTSSKNSNYIVFRRIIRKSKNQEKILDLLNENKCVVKTINLEENDTLRESMSLKVFKFVDIYKERWEESELFTFFNETAFIFVIFKKNFIDTCLQDIKVWKMPEYILNSGVKGVWLNTKELISKGKIVNYIDARGRYKTYFLKSSDTKYVHVRPHAQNTKDVYPLPVPDKTTGKTEFMKHSFWLNRNFIKKIVVEGKYYE